MTIIRTQPLDRGPSDTLLSYGLREHNLSLEAARRAGSLTHLPTIQRATPAVEAVNFGTSSILFGRALGDVQYSTWPGQLIMPRVQVRVGRAPGGNRTNLVELPVWTRASHAIHNAQRPINAPYNWSVVRPDRVAERLEYRGFAAVDDDRVLANASPEIDYSQVMSQTASGAVDRYLELEVSQAVLNTTPYLAGHAVALAPGSEWDAPGGDSKGSLAPIFAAIEADSGVHRSSLIMTLTSIAAYEAALECPTFLDWRNTQGRPSSEISPELEELRRYWRVGAVNAADIHVPFDDGSLQSLWGDAAVIHYQGNQPSAPFRFDTFFGQPLTAALLEAAPGVSVSSPRRLQDMSTRTVWSVDTMTKPWITSYQTLGLITNVKA